MRATAAALLSMAGLGCRTLDPAEAYREAARNLTFRLDRVEPHFELALPLDRSRLRLRLRLGVENPSDVRLTARSLGGRLSLQVGQDTHDLGQVTFPAGVDLAPRGRSEVLADLAFDYAALRRAWGPLTDVLERHAPATWRLEGQAEVQAYGLTLTLPLRATRESGRGARD